MTDERSSAVQWGMSRSDMIVFPIGATEQHGPHLPVNTDSVLAEYFGRKIADYFDCAMLPVQSIASSLEHSGWRGSFSLRPQTLISLVHDIAEEAERQNYTVMIIVTGHGGNFPLGPACRDWNRRDRKLKLLLVYPFIHADSMMRKDRMDIHSGEYETAVMRYISGAELAFNGDYICGNQSFLKQSDLNTFGMGHLNPHGIIGYPADADLSLGRRLTEHLITASIQEVEERLALLAKSPRYCGSGGLYLRQCTREDMPQLRELIARVGWNQIDRDFENFLDHGEIWSMIHLNRPVGCGAWIKRSGDIAWIGMVITLPEWRGCGIAPQIMGKLIERSSHLKYHLLDASAMGEKVYRKMGFADMYKVTRMKLPQKLTPPKDCSLQWQQFKGAAADLPWTDNCDPMIDRLLQQNPETFYCGSLNGRIVAWFALRPGRKSQHMGPLYAQDHQAAASAAAYAVSVAGAGELTIDIMNYQTEFFRYLQDNGSELCRDFLRMSLPEIAAERMQSENMFAAVGPEYG
ncbi:MAG: GNAT family N-acetyltransferase [Lentisphaerae bacterium]|nr:GNAT family N-acetyltransferase [Lentisphaerota bacterium]